MTRAPYTNNRQLAGPLRSSSLLSLYFPLSPPPPCWLLGMGNPLLDISSEVPLTRQSTKADGHCMCTSCARAYNLINHAARIYHVFFGSAAEVPPTPPCGFPRRPNEKFRKTEKRESASAPGVRRLKRQGQAPRPRGDDAVSGRQKQNFVRIFELPVPRNAQIGCQCFCKALL
jgi:hypothetical protein